MLGFSIPTESKFNLDYEGTKNRDIHYYVITHKFSAGGYTWAVHCHPHGPESDNGNGNCVYLSLYLQLLDESATVEVIFEAFVMDRRGDPGGGKRFVRVIPPGGFWGFPHFMEQEDLEWDFVDSKVAEVEELVRVHRRRLILLLLVSHGEETATVVVHRRRSSSRKKQSRRRRRLRSRWPRRAVSRHGGGAVVHLRLHDGELGPRGGEVALRGADLLVQAVDDPRAAVNGVLHPPPRLRRHGVCGAASLLHRQALHAHITYISTKKWRTTTKGEGQHRHLVLADEGHPELAPEPDVEALMRRHSELARPSIAKVATNHEWWTWKWHTSCTDEEKDPQSGVGQKQGGDGPRKLTVADGSGTLVTKVAQ
ncbi:hypothetical protein EJB05_48198, partial [Eragrostis curvula]